MLTTVDGALKLFFSIIFRTDGHSGQTEVTFPTLSSSVDSRQ